MCFSFEVSLLTGIFSWISGIYMLMNYTLPGTQYNDVILLLIVSSMQFADAILWKSGMKKDFTNFFVTSYVIPLILTLQIAYSILVRNKQQGILGWSIVLGMAAYYFTRFKGYSTSVCGDTLSSPVWGSKEFPIHILFLHYALLAYPRINVITILPLLFTLLFFNGAFGSIWCSLVCVASIGFLINFK